MLKFFAGMGVGTRKRYLLQGQTLDQILGGKPIVLIR